MKQVLSIFGGLVSFVICIILFSVQISFLVLLSTQGFFKGDGIKDIVKNIDVKEILLNNSESAPTQEIYEITDVYGISREDTDKIMESDTLKSFIADYASNNINALLGDGEYPNIKVEDINNLIDDVIEEKEITISEENKNEIKTYLLENSAEIEEVLSIGEAIEKEITPDTKATIGVIFGGTLMVAFIVTLVILFLLIMLCRWSFYKALIWYGVTTVLSSLITLAFGFGIRTSLNFIDMSSYQDYYEIINNVVGSTQKVIITYGVIALVVGAIFITGYILIHKNKLNKQEETKKIEQPA